MLKALQRILTISLLVIAGLYLLYQAFLYWRARDQFPPGTTIAGLDVTHLSPAETAELLSAHYLAPVAVYHGQERIELQPQDVGFVLDTESMIRMANAEKGETEFWRGYLEFLIGRSLEPVVVDLYATHDRALLAERLQMIASFLDEPATGPQLLGETATFQFGRPGFVTDVDASLTAVEDALYRATQRQAELIIQDQPAPELDMAFLEEAIRRQLEPFDGVGSVFVLDLQTGEEVSINADVAMSGLSIVKIAILLETYRALDLAPTSDQLKLINETAVESGNFSANLLLDIVAGQNNAYLGVDILTESMQRLGLVNTFIVTPYEEPNRAGKFTQATPANSRTDVNTNPDLTMQTTAEDMGTLLAMIYRCAQGGGTLLAVYPESLTPDECQAIIDVMIRNVEGNLIRFGVPETTPVSHKHGWAGNTHGDAGLVLSPNGDYVIVEYLAQPNSDWLVYETSFPILREISRATYNYFNFEEPYTGDALAEAQRLEGESAASGGDDEAPDQGQDRAGQ